MIRLNCYRFNATAGFYQSYFANTFSPDEYCEVFWLDLDSIPESIEERPFIIEQLQAERMGLA